MNRRNAWDEQGHPAVNRRNAGREPDETAEYRRGHPPEFQAMLGVPIRIPSGSCNPPRTRGLRGVGAGWRNSPGEPIRPRLLGPTVSGWGHPATLPPATSRPEAGGSNYDPAARQGRHGACNLAVHHNARGTSWSAHVGRVRTARDERDYGLPQRSGMMIRGGQLSLTHGLDVAAPNAPERTGCDAGCLQNDRRCTKPRRFRWR